MKVYISLCAVCYALLLILPLPLLPSSAQDETSPTTTPSLTDKTDKPSPSDDETFTLLDESAGVLYTFTCRDLLIYTMAAELPLSFHEEALKAQAVAIYTHYSYEKRLNADSKTLQGADTAYLPAQFPDLYSPEGLKSHWGDRYDANLQAVTAALEAVAGEQILYNDAPILAARHYANWGRTETAEVAWGTAYPYLQSVVSSGDLTEKEATAVITVSDDEFSQAFSSLSLTGTGDGWISSEPLYSPAGSVTALTVGGRAFTGSEIQSALSLPSPHFSVSRQEGGFSFEVKGNGHGVGLSACGANAMAQQGFSYKEILQHYYTDVAVN